MSFKRKLIKRLRKFDRLEVLHLLRDEDITVAYYCEETDQLVLFIDVIIREIKTHFEAWGKIKTDKIEHFTPKFISTVFLHELFHWCGLERSKLCQYLALWLIWDTTTAAIVSNWMYSKDTQETRIVVLDLV